MSDYFSDKDKIKSLTEQLSILNKKLVSTGSERSRYKRLYHELKGDKPTEFKGVKAMALIKDLKGTGKPVDLIRRIAKECFLSESRVDCLWYKS